MKESYYFCKAIKSDRTDRIHITMQTPFKTLCGNKTTNMKKITESQAVKNKAPICANCLSGLSKTKPEKAKKFQEKVSPLRRRKKYKDEVANPKLKKFKSIINSAKEKRRAIDNSISSVLDEKESSFDKMQSMLDSVTKLAKEAIIEKQKEWDDDFNQFNDIKYFHQISSLKNLIQISKTIEKI